MVAPSRSIRNRPTWPPRPAWVQRGPTTHRSQSSRRSRRWWGCTRRTTRPDSSRSTDPSDPEVRALAERWPDLTVS